MKTCTTCNASKAATEFHKNNAAPGGLSYTCKGCISAYCKARYVRLPDSIKQSAQDRAKARYVTNPEPHKAFSKKWYAGMDAKTRGKFNLHHDLKKRGLTILQFETMLENQKGLCKICGNPPPINSGKFWKRLVVDHCHSSDLVRGLLCMPCNLMLGHAKDRPERLLEGARYLNDFLSATSPLGVANINKQKKGK